MLTSVLREESPNEELFDFIEDSIIYFDSCREGFANFHIAFLAGLSSYLGFEPGPRNQRRIIHILTCLTGFLFQFLLSMEIMQIAEISDILAAFFSSSYENINNIILTGALRNEVLETLVKYYSLHLPGLKKNQIPRSAERGFQSE